MDKNYLEKKLNELKFDLLLLEEFIKKSSSKYRKLVEDSAGNTCEEERDQTVLRIKYFEELINKKFVERFNNYIENAKI